jgi:hypothetical protein
MAYQIRVRDHLDTSWSAWFDGWQMTNLEGGDVLLANASADQSALHGALNKVRDLNLKLISVQLLEPAASGAGAAGPQMEQAEHRKETQQKASIHENHQADPSG